MKYQYEYLMGRAARSEASCPYTRLQLGKRCAWLAGFRDKQTAYL